VVFAEMALKPSQSNLLAYIYSARYATNKERIDDMARIPLYAKPLLGALYVLTLKEKAGALINYARAEGTPESVCSVASAGIDFLVDRASAKMASLAGLDDPWMWLAYSGSATISRAVRLYRDHELDGGSLKYWALHRGSVPSIAQNPDLPAL